ncbi:MAG TPA: hypothetical protein VF803_02575, partial [Candidatus Paceibacterota bacterium]
AILLAVAGIIIVAGSAYYLVGHKKVSQQSRIRTNTQLVTGDVVRAWKGENKVNYSIYIPKDATTTVGMNGALVRAYEGKNLYAAVYLSYEGERGYAPEEYINRIIAPQVHVLDEGATTTIGSYTWTTAESSGSEWHVAPVMDGTWLVVVESPKANHDRVVDTLDNLIIK